MKVYYGFVRSPLTYNMQNKKTEGKPVNRKNTPFLCYLDIRFKPVLMLRSCYRSFLGFCEKNEEKYYIKV